MSVHLQDVVVPASRGGAVSHLFNRLDVDIPDGARVGVLGAPKSGKTTLLRLICGTVEHERGRVRRASRISWPIPLSAVLSTSATVAQNIGFIGRLYGISDPGFCRRIVNTVGLDEFVGVPLRKCPKFARPRLAFALGIGLDFDVYLFDGSLTPVDKPFKEEALELVTRRMQGRGYVLATASPPEVEPSCDVLYVLDAGRARYFPDVNAGLEFFKELTGSQKQKRRKGGRREEDSDGEEDEDALGDVDILGAAVADGID